MTYDPVTYWRERGQTYEAAFHRTPAFEAQEAALADLLGRLTFRDVLEVGCGFGRIGALILAIRPEAEYTGIDVSPDMLASARLRLPGARFVETTFDAFIGRFDLVVASEFLMHQPPERIIETVAKLQRRTRRSLVTVDWEAPGESAGTYCWGHDYRRLLPGAQRFPVGDQAIWHWQVAA